MTLHRHRRLMRPGLPEAVGLILLAATVVSAAMWWRTANQPNWVRTAGRPLEFSAQATHYNAQDACTKVSLVYEYEALGMTYKGRFVGLWPEVESPNALPPDRLSELDNKEFPLVVMYDPAHPEISKVHLPSGAASVFLTGCLIATLFLSLVYGLKVYPAWRSR